MSARTAVVFTAGPATYELGVVTRGDLPVIEAEEVRNARL